jgi:hypothetical protein
VSNAHSGKTPPSLTTSPDGVETAVLRRDQEMAHVQSRVGSASWEAPVGEGGPAAPAGRGGTGGTLLPPPGPGRGALAALLRLASAACGLAAAVLFVLPGATGMFVVPPPQTAAPAPQNLKVITPTFDEPAPAEAMDGAVSEQTSSFDGATVLVVYSNPTGVAVEVDGNDQGGTPVSLTLDCLPGKPIRVELFKRGYERLQHTAFCRKDTMIKLFAPMRKAAKAPSGKP